MVYELEWRPIMERVFCVKGLINYEGVSFIRLFSTFEKAKAFFDSFTNGKYNRHANALDFVSIEIDCDEDEVEKNIDYKCLFREDVITKLMKEI